MPPTTLFGLGYGTGPAGYGYPPGARRPSISYPDSPFTWYDHVEITAALPTNGGGPITNYSVLSGSLPAGVSLNATTGELTGTPTTQQSAASVVIRARGPGGVSDTTISVEVLAMPLSLGSSLAAWWDGTDLSTLWQNTAKTTPAASDGDRVRVIADKSGNGNDLIFPDDARRGTLKLNIVNGKAVVRLNGSDQYAEAAISLYSAAPLSILGASICRAYTDCCLVAPRNSNNESTITSTGSAQAIADLLSGRPQGIRAASYGTPAFRSWPKGSVHPFYSVFNGTTHAVYGERGILRGSTSDTNAWGIDRILVGGRYHSGVNKFAQHDIVQIVVVEAAATQAQVLAYDGYMQSLVGTWTVPQVVCDGDSMTRGTNAIGYCSPYPALLRSLLPDGWTTANDGISGQSMDAIASDALTTVDPFYDANRTKNVVLIWGGTNDVLGGSSAATIMTKIESYCAARRSAGFQVLPFTLQPIGTNAAHETVRQDFNTLLRAASGTAPFQDGIVDIAANTDIGDDGDQNDATYYDPVGKVHMTNAGYAIVAEIARVAVEAL